MDITTEVKIERHGLDTKNSRLTINVKIDGHPTGQVVALSGPTVDIDAYVAGEISFEEVQRRWSPAAQRRMKYGDCARLVDLVEEFVEDSKRRIPSR